MECKAEMVVMDPATDYNIVTMCYYTTNQFQNSRLKSSNREYNVNNS
jgi:hypothetical protein